MELFAADCIFNLPATAAAVCDDKDRCDHLFLCYNRPCSEGWRTALSLDHRVNAGCVVSVVV